MDADEYLGRFESVKSFHAKQKLLREALDKENEDRGLFSQQRESWQVPEIQDPYKSLVKAFDDDPDAEPFTRRARFLKRQIFPEEAELPRLFKDEKREAKLAADPSVPNLQVFREQFLQVFSCNILQYLNWDNIVVAGGAVVGCLQPIPAKYKSAIEKRKYYHDDLFTGSDIDIFLWGLSEEEANAKLIEIYDQVCQACPFEVICFRSAHAVTMVSQYPYRHIQVVLRIYSSPYEVLAGFDVDSCTFLYDGDNVYATPRGHHALTAGYNTVDMSRRSPSYEMRLAKYASRGFEVVVPDYDANRIDPNIFDKPFSLLQGLSRLVVLEQLRTPLQRLEYNERQAAKRGGARNAISSRFRRDARALERLEKMGGSAEQSNYSTVFLGWGPGFTARGTLKMMKEKDRAMNGPWFAKDRSYNLHPCFWGTAEEILNDCSPTDPPIPEDTDPDLLKPYVRGPLVWMQDDPGRQQVGSFNPITSGDWEDGAYFLTTTGAVFLAVNANDGEALRTALRDSIDVLGEHQSRLCRDFLGRSPLHLAVLAGAVEAAEVIAELGAVDPSLRMPDGRNALHLCAQYNCPAIARSVLRLVRSFVEAREVYDELPDLAKAEQRRQGIAAPRKFSAMEVVDAEDLDHKLSPLQYAIILGRVEVARVLINEGQAVATKFSEISLKSGRLVFTAQPCGGIGLPRSLSSGYISTVLLSPLLLVDVGHGLETAKALVHLLMENGARSHSCIMMAKFNSVFHVCASRGDTELARLLVEDLKTSAPDLLARALSLVNCNLYLPVAEALSRGYIECAKLLFSELPLTLPDAPMCAKIRVLASKVDLSGFNWQEMRMMNKLQSIESSEALDPLVAAVDNLCRIWVVSSGNGHARYFARGVLYNSPWRSANEDDEDADAPTPEEEAELHGLLECIEWMLDHGSDPSRVHKGDRMHEFGGLQVSAPTYGSDAVEGIPLPKLLEQTLSTLRDTAALSFTEDSRSDALSAAASAAPEGSYRQFVLSLGARIFASASESEQGLAYGKRCVSSMRKIKLLLDLLKEAPKTGHGAATAQRKSMTPIGQLRAWARRSATKKPEAKRADLLKELDSFLEVGDEVLDADLQLDGPAKSRKEQKRKPQQTAKAVCDAIVFGFSLASVSGSNVYYYYNTRTAGASVPEAAMETVLATFEAAYAGDVNGLRAIIARADNLEIPLLSTLDAVGNSLLTVAAMSRSANRAEVLAILLDRAAAEYVPESERLDSKAKKASPTRIDNLKLLDADDDLSSVGSAADKTEVDSDEDVEELAAAHKLLQVGNDDDEVDESGRKNMHTLNDAMNADACKSRLTVLDLVMKCGKIPESWVINDMALPGPAQELLRTKAASKNDPMRPTGEVDVQVGFQLNALHVAILRGDADAVKVILERVGASETPAKEVYLNPAHYLAEKSSAAQLAISFDRVDILELLLEHAAGGIQWRGIAAAVEVKPPQQRKGGDRGATSQSAPRRQRYKGMVSCLESKGRNQVLGERGDQDGDEEESDEDADGTPLSKAAGKALRALRSANMTQYPLTWLEVAVIGASSRTIAWITGHFEEIVGHVERMMADDPSGAAMARFGRAMHKQRASLPLAALNPQLAEASTAYLLAAAAVCINPDDLSQRQTNGFNLLAAAIVSKSVEMVHTVLVRAPALLNEPIWADFKSKSKKAKTRRGTSVMPMIAAAQIENMGAFTVLMKAGCSPTQVSPGTGDNALQALIRMKKYDAAKELIDLVGETAGPDTLREMVSNLNEEGHNVVMQIFGSSALDARRINELLDGLLTSGLFQVTDREGRSLLHGEAIRAANGQSGPVESELRHRRLKPEVPRARDESIALLLKWAAGGSRASFVRLALSEDLRGSAPLDLYLQNPASRVLRPAPGLASFPRADPAAVFVDPVAVEDAPRPRELVSVEKAREFVFDNLKEQEASSPFYFGERYAEVFDPRVFSQASLYSSLQCITLEPSILPEPRESQPKA